MLPLLKDLGKEMLLLIFYLILITVMTKFILNICSIISFPQYTDVANYLATGKLPAHLSKREKRNIIQQSARYCWIDGHLFYIGHDLEIRRCLREDEILSILKSCHDNPHGGYFVDKCTGHKLL